MRVADVFRANGKTIFTGDLYSDAKVIQPARALIEIDGRAVGEVAIEGEVRTRNAHRDLWTRSPFNLPSNVIRDHEVWLVSG